MKIHYNLHRILMSTLLIIVLAIFASCDLFEPEKDTGNIPPRDLTTAEKSLVSADNKFGLNLFRALNDADPDSNLFISPLSISMALGMTLNGAADSTYRAMVETLGKAHLLETDVNQAYRSLIYLLTNLDPKVVFQIANSIWYRQGFTVEQPFLDTNREYFDAEVSALDFTDPQSVDIINGWVDDKTQGKIDEIIMSIDPMTVMYLINAIYFKGAWAYEFDKAQTEDQPFYNLNGSTTTIPLMTLEGTLPVLHRETFSALDIPYGDSLFSMTVFLPAEGITVNDLILQINQAGGLFISDVIHKTFVEVNEEGTEAAAVTAVIITDTAVGGPAIFRVDKPFVFAIRERHSGTILFIGKVVEL